MQQNAHILPMNNVKIIRNEQNSNEEKNYNSIMINLIIFVNYICSFLSITSNSYQPSLISLTLWVKESLSIISVTSYFGYHHVYYLQGNEQSKLQTFLDDLGKEDLFQYTGYSFIISLSFSLFFLLFSKFYNKILFFRFLSWGLLLFSIGSYLIGFYNTMHEELHSDDYNLFDWNIRPGFGLISSCLNLLLIPVSY